VGIPEGLFNFLTHSEVRVSKASRTQDSGRFGEAFCYKIRKNTDSVRLLNTVTGKLPAQYRKHPLKRGIGEAGCRHTKN
jgi:hypothetical protein